MLIKMKKYFALLFSLAFFTVTYAQQEKFFGHWQNTDSLNPISGFDFKPNGTALMYNNNNPSPEFALKIDDSKQPIALNLTLQKDNIEVTLYGLFEFATATTAKLTLYKQPLGENSSGQGEHAMVLMLNKE